MSPARPQCPKHGDTLVKFQTQYGDRWGCPAPGCDVRCWAGSTSTPCDGETAKARNAMHRMFDPLWEQGLFSLPSSGRGQRRRDAYRWLSNAMGTPIHLTHFGMFDFEQCQRARELVETFKSEAGVAS